MDMHEEYEIKNSVWVTITHLLTVMNSFLSTGFLSETFS